MNSIYRFLTKMSKKIFLITLLSTALLFSSCINDLFNSDKASKKQASQTEQTNSDELITVKINIDNKQQIENIVGSITPQINITPARAASPKTVTLSYKILYKKVTEASPSSTVTVDNADYTRDVTDTDNQIPLTTGTWDFTLIAYYKDDSDNEKAVFSGDVLNQQISPDTSNSLSFTLQEISGKGNIKITLTIPASTEYTSVVKAQLSQIVSGTGFTPVSGYTESVLTVNSTDSTSNSYVYTQNEVQNGTFYVVFSITTTNTEAASDSSTASSSTETTTYPVPVRVVTSLTSSSTETLTDIRNVCVITYALGTDGTVSWKDGTTPERVYKKYQNVTLPTYEKLAPIETKIFNGWKDQDGTKVTSPMNITQNVTLEPIWITTTLYVDGISTSTESDALSTTTAVNTLSAAVNKLVTYEALDDGDDTSYQHEWTINVNGTCSGTSDLSSLKITKLTITGDNNTQDILDGSEGTGSVITKAPQNEGTYPLFIEYLTIQKGSNTSGGGLNITNSTAYLNNVVLINNTASENGGAIALTASKLFIYGGCQIGPETATNTATDTACSNRADVSGGGIYADANSTIYFGYTDADETNVTMTAENGTPSNIITYNYAGGPSESTYGGGGIYCLGKLYINGGTISYNRAARKGGGIYTKSLSMKGSTVSNNAATYEGGAIYIEATQTTKSFITSADFNGTTTSTKISGNTSENPSDNTPNSHGGGIAFYGGELYISDTIISGNKATSKGGGIYVNKWSSYQDAKLFLYGETTIGATSANKCAESVSASSNSAAAGGGIYLDSSTQAYLNYSSENATAHTGTVNITYNYVQTDFGNLGGGGIFADSGSELYIAPGTTINYNATSMYGGGIFGNGNTTYMSGGTIYGNYAQQGGGIYLTGRDYEEYGLDLIHYGTLYMFGDAKIGTSENPNSAQYGGGIYLANSYSQAYLGDGEKNLSGGVSYNKAVDPDYDGLGGGIYNKGRLQVSSGSISNNISETNGGGVYNLSDIEFTMTGGTIASNTAKNGGGVYNERIFNVSSGNIKSNTATGNGGGIYTTSTDTTHKTVLENSEITENKAENGGGVYIAGGKLDIKGATIFKENKATGNGGGIFSGSNSKLFISGTTTIGADEASTPATSESNSNSATCGGGIYISGNSSAYINYSSEDDTAHTGSVKITYNYSNATDYTEGGGGIYTAENSNLYIAGDTTINYNASPKNGGGIFNLGTLVISDATIESNTAAPDDGSGGGILTKQSMSLTDTIITNNEACFGGGIFLSSPNSSSTESKLYIKKATQFISNSGKYGGAVCTYRAKIIIQDQEETKYAYIKPNPDCNDVFLQTTDSTISIDSALSPTNHYFARITPPNTYTEGPYLTGDENKVSTEYKKFLVTPQTVTDTTGMTTQILWETTSAGTIKESNTTFVKIPAAKITEPVTGSGVFIEERPALELPSYYICDHEVTQGEYEKYCTYGGNVGTWSEEYWNNWVQQSDGAKVIKGDNYPACFVSWYDALVYCNLRSIAEGLDPVYYFEGTPPSTHPKDWDGVSWEEKDGITKYHGPSPDDTVDPWSEIKQDLDKSGWRLPLEAEWEYAARGASNMYDDNYNYIYSGSNTLTEVAWMVENAKSGDNYYPHEVKKLAANSLGLYDMSGSVVELCWDWYTDNLAGIGVEGPTTGTEVAAPGGAYQYPRDLNTRSSNRKNARFCNAGFRIVRTIPE